MRCERDGCGGMIDDTGYCDRCGHAPAGPGRVGGGPVGAASTAAEVSRPAPTTGASRRSQTSSARLSTRGGLGAGLVSVPPVEYLDPTSVVLANPEVPESRRFCSNCEHPVGRSRDGRPGRMEAHCPHCGAKYSFTPKLNPGDLVGGQYEVVGCLAHGGMGWVYLARDGQLDGRWVVLKGLLDEGDEAAMAAAIAERRFLSQVVHPNIVTIHNFVQHGGSGYIVMEYVGGPSLKDLRRGPDGALQPIPVAHAIAYLLEVLPALAYLHAHGMLYCDFKPDNVIQTEERVKLIDLGGVRRIDDDTSYLYGTVGYQAPEVPEHGPSIASDLYTVARTLAVLVFDFKGFQDPNRYVSTLPPVGQVPVFRRYPALHRFLLRGMHRDPGLRFQSADEMAEQLLGVLRQVVAIDGGSPAPAPSRLFTPELGLSPEEPTWRVLPLPAVDRNDPVAGLLAGLAGAPPAQLLAALEALPEGPEANFQKARAYLDLDEGERAAEIIGVQAKEDPGDWRCWWWQGVLELVEGRPKEAGEDFERVACELPGELAPVLAMAVAAEAAADVRNAASFYDLVSRTDPGYANACFGLARTYLQTGDRASAAEALRRVPAGSVAYSSAQVLLCSVLSGGRNGSGPDHDDLVAASAVLGRVAADDRQKAVLTREVLLAALDLAVRSPAGEVGVEVAGVPFDEGPLRRALEQTCRQLARLSATESERMRLVDEANSHRPRSLL